MANQGGGREATDPTGSVLPFDPVLGTKHFGEIQEEGLRAAGALVERLVLLVDGPRVGPDADPDPARSEGTAGPADPGAVLPWFELWSDLVGRTAETMQRFRGVDRGPAGDGV
ncbi:MAG: hypothetical protein Q8K72_18765, partial [Acidimicrobiales bacterium]|nr:hypothetical protein [Acidimicrobiales bacterium]